MIIIIVIVVRLPNLQVDHITYLEIHVFTITITYDDDVMLV